MTPLSNRLLMVLPALLMVGLVLFSAAPITFISLSLAPNVTWLAVIALARVVPQAVPAWLAFLVGLLQDVVFATPLGSHATIALLLLLAVRARPSRVGIPLLRDVWVEAAVLLLAAQLTLYALLQWMAPTTLPIYPQVGAFIVNILWFPLVAWVAARFAMLLPK